MEPRLKMHMRWIDGKKNGPITKVCQRAFAAAVCEICHGISITTTEFEQQALPPSSHRIHPVSSL